MDRCNEAIFANVDDDDSDDGNGDGKLTLLQLLYEKAMSK